MIDPDAEIAFVRREECRKCDGEVWAIYYFTADGNEAGYGVVPINLCGDSRRCGDKVEGAELSDVVRLCHDWEGAA